MQELLLYGQIRDGDGLVQRLAAFTQTKPERLIERHAVYAPKTMPTGMAAASYQAGATQQINQKKKQPSQNPANQDTLYTKAVQHLQGTDFGAGESKQSDALSEWSVINNDVPLPGQRPVIQRTTCVYRVLRGDLHQAMISERCRFISEYITDGIRLSHGSISIRVYQIKTFAQTEHVITAPRADLPALESLSLLDPSGAYMVEASVMLESEPSPKLVRQGTEHLLRFQDDMQGVVKLTCPERLALDTRVKASVR